MDSMPRSNYIALLEQLESENEKFLVRARYRATSNDEWLAFYDRILKALEPHFVGESWKLTAVERLLPTLRAVVMRHLTQGFEDWPLFVLLFGRIEVFVDYVRRWTVLHNAQRPEDYAYCTTTCLAMQLLYANDWMPAWVHDALRQLIKDARQILEPLGDEVALAALLQQFGSTMKLLCKQVRNRRCSPNRWAKHMRVVVKWLVLTGALLPDSDEHELVQENARRLLTPVIVNEKDDAKAFGQLLLTAADLLRNAES